MSHSTQSLSLYIAEHARLVPRTKQLSATNQNRARGTLILRQPIRIEHEKTLPCRQPIRNECYVTQPIKIEPNVTRELSATVEDPISALGSYRLAIVYLITWGLPNPPPPHPPPPPPRLIFSLSNY